MQRERGALDQALDRASGLVAQAVGVAGWLNRTGWDVARRLPGGATAERAVRPVEEAVGGQMRQGLRSLGLLDAGATGAGGRAVEVLDAAAALDGAGARRLDGRPGGRPGEHRVTAVVRPLNDHEPLRAAMAELLNRSVEQTREQSEHQLFAGILRQLVPDEARMLAAMSDGSRHPVIHVASRGPFGGIKRMILENASTLGRAAGLRLAANTPTFVTHLRQLGLLEVDPEDRSLAVQYDILQADELVRAAEAQARVDGRGAAKIIRQTVRLSELGRHFWDACQPARPSLPASPRVDGHS